MLFNSLKYLLFLPSVYVVYYFVGERVRWCVLLAASLLFYAALNIPYLPIVLSLVALTTYSFGIWLDRAESHRSKRTLLWGGVTANVLILVCMKYLPFLSSNLNTVSAWFSVCNFSPAIFPTLVSIGVSYYVFQAISYLIDIYLEIEKPELHFGYFALYLSFFPKLLQGPIERSSDLIPQLKNRYEFNYDNMRFGLLLFTWGFFKKVVIADRLGFYADTVYNDVHAYTGLSLLFGTYAYAFQIYMDFSGYTDMALGSARLFNINLTQNFNSPYLATSVADFWRRWHISFSRWILDYIFKPLQMRWRDSKNWGTAAALIIAFLISGLWHGASWGFVIWGGLHGLYMACSAIWKPYQKRLYKALRVEKTPYLKSWQIFITFNLVSLAWVFFRANSLDDALYVVLNLIHRPVSNRIIDMLIGTGINQYNLMVLSISLVLILLVHFQSGKVRFTNCPTWFRWGVYFLLTLWVILFQAEGAASFLYLRF